MRTLSEPGSLTEPRTPQRSHIPTSGRSTQHPAPSRRASPLSSMKRPEWRRPPGATSSTSRCGRLDTMTSGSHCRPPSSSPSPSSSSSSVPAAADAGAAAGAGTAAAAAAAGFCGCAACRRRVLPRGAAALLAPLLLALLLPSAAAAAPELPLASLSAGAEPLLLLLPPPPLLLRSAARLAAGRAPPSRSAGCWNRSEYSTAPRCRRWLAREAATAAAGESTLLVAAAGSVGRRGGGGIVTAARRSTSYLPWARRGDRACIRQAAAGRKAGLLAMGATRPRPQTKTHKKRRRGRAPDDAHDAAAVWHARHQATHGKLHKQRARHAQRAQLEAVGAPAGALAAWGVEQGRRGWVRGRAAGGGDSRPAPLALAGGDQSAAASTPVPLWCTSAPVSRRA